MAGNHEIYKKVKSLLVPGHTFENIQGVNAMPGSAPFKAGHIPFLSLVSVNGNMDSNQGVFEDRLIKISSIHGRSYEMRFGEAGNIYWADEYRNIYSSLTTKGNNLVYPKVFKNDVSPSGFLVYGLQDSDSMVRILKGSELLRSNNIETEIILKVIEPQQLPFGEQLVSIVDFKRNLIHQVWEEDADKDSVDQQIRLKKVAREEIPALSIALDKMTFFITVRGHQVSERLQDLTLPETKEEFVTIMRRVFSFVNKLEEIKGKKDSSYTPNLFDAGRDEDIEKYLTEYLPSKIAMNFAKLHNLGLVHFFPHSGNISAVGSIYDLDSVRGKPLGLNDKAITDDDIQGDLHKLLFGEADISANGLIDTIGLLQQKGFINKNSELVNRILFSFYKKYIEQRGWENDVVKNLDKIYTFFEGFNWSDDLADNLIAYYLTKISGQLGWDYSYPEDDSLLQTDYAEEVLRSAEVRFQEIKEDEDSSQKQEELEKKSVSKIEATRHGNPIFRTIERDLRRKLGNELQDVTKFYGQGISDIIVVMYGLKYEERIRDQLEEKKDQTNEVSYNYFSKAIKDEGWEENLISHLKEIYELFDGFALEHSEEYLDYYLSLFCQKLNYEFRYEEEDINQVIDEYIGFCRRNMEAAFRIEAKDVSASTDIKALIEATCREHKYGEEITELPWEQEMWEIFLNERLWPFYQDYKTYESMLEKQYGEEAIGYAWMFLTAKAELELSKKFDPLLVGVPATAKQEKMEYETIKRYLENPQFIFSKDASNES